MIGDEARVVDAFCAYLEAHGWDIQREVNLVDIVATRNGVTLLAEAKGRTSSPGLDVDTLYGQLLRRIPGAAVGTSVLAVVVPDIAVKFALRVPVEVRDALGIHVYGVGESGELEHVGHGADPVVR